MPGTKLPAQPEETFRFLTTSSRWFSPANAKPEPTTMHPLMTQIAAFRAPCVADQLANNQSRICRRRTNMIRQQDVRRMSARDATASDDQRQPTYRETCGSLFTEYAARSEFEVHGFERGRTAHRRAAAGLHVAVPALQPARRRRRQDPGRGLQAPPACPLWRQRLRVHWP